ELEALETTEMLPVTLPAEFGAKTTPKVKLCPGIKVSGRFNPLTLKAESERLAWVMLTLEPPELVSVSDWVELLPTCTLPKLMVEEVGCSTVVGGLIPVPESGTESGELELMFGPWDEETTAVTDIAPTTLPLVVGVNVTLKVALWPGAKLNGRPRPPN
ncbi:MAG TPA: hypothetical protein VFQ43_07390, partial [Nitrososphaera sp.]|nr:hypothetical protein [Nitrososphaera sp.]